MTPYQSKLSALRKVVEAGTKGTWTINHDPLPVIEAGRFGIARCYAFDQAEANATLIVTFASPDRATAMLDLLEAYETLVIAQDEQIENFNHGSADWRKAEQTRTAESRLAKAKEKM